MMPASETKSITLRIRAVGDKVLKAVSKDIKKISKNTKAMKRDFSGLRNIFLGVFAGRGIKAIVGMADNVQLLNDRINAFVGDADKGTSAMNTLFDAANLTNQSIDTLAEGFNRVALATQEFGLTTNEIIGFTTTLQNAFRIQGASAAEATGATIQLTQGLSSGALRGQELRSVLEASSVAAGVLSDAVGITRGQLIKFAETGAFTTDVVLKAFADRALELNERAGKLGTTFGQTLVKATNRFKKGLNELNKDAGLSKKFETSVLGAVDSIEKLIKAVNRSDGFGKFITFMGDYVKVYSELAAKVLGQESPLESVNRQIGNTLNTVDAAEKELKRVQSRGGIAGLITDIFTVTPGKKGSSLRSRDVDILKKRISDGKILIGILSKQKKAMLELGPTVDDTGKKTNAALVSIQDFAKLDLSATLSKVGFTLKGLNLSWRDGDIGIRKYKEGLLALQNQDINKNFDEGKITLDEYNKKIEEVAINLGILEGRYGPLELGAKKAFDNIGTIAVEMTDVIGDAFSTLEDSLLDFTKTGKFLFADFAQSVIDDIARIAIRQAIIKPITGSLFGPTTAGSASSSSFVGPPTPNAKGNIFSGGDIQAFASGGVVNSPTFFPTNSGTGLMGEAGPEAIVPLTRVSGGDLGIKAVPSKVIVNVNNSAGVEVGVEESSTDGTRVLDITITKAVKNAINEGRFDKSFSSNFGVSRKGSR